MRYSTSFSHFSVANNKQKCYTFASFYLFFILHLLKNFPEKSWYFQQTDIFFFENIRYDIFIRKLLTNAC